MRHKWGTDRRQRSTKRHPKKFYHPLNFAFFKNPESEEKAFRWCYFVGRIWNSLPQSIRSVAGTNKFKADIWRRKFIHT